jgi:hypothetical protein
VSAEALAVFIQVVVADVGLQKELLATADRETFVALVVQRAAGAGCDVSGDDVEQGLRDGRRAWLARWI